MTRKTGAALCLLLWSASAAAGAADPAAGNASSVVRSPDGRLQLELLAPAGAAGRLRYRVTFSGHPVVEASNLGVRLANGTELGRETEIVGATPATIDESFEQYPGKRRLVADRANEQLASWVAVGGPVRVERDHAGLSARRTWVCELPEGRTDIPCGGTHVRDLAELGRVTVSLAVRQVDGGLELTMDTTVAPDQPAH